VVTDGYSHGLEERALVNRESAKTQRVGADSRTCQTGWPCTLAVPHAVHLVVISLPHCLKDIQNWFPEIFKLAVGDDKDCRLQNILHSVITIEMVM
jgi:hypothetical protein